MKSTGGKKIAIRERPRTPTLVDFEIRGLGGTTTAFDTMPESIQAAKDPTSTAQRIIELSRENGRLRQEIAYYRTLVDGVLTPLMPVVQFHVNGLHSAVRRCNTKIEHANAQWEANKMDKMDQGHVSCKMESPPNSAVSTDADWRTAAQ